METIRSDTRGYATLISIVVLLVVVAIAIGFILAKGPATGSLGVGLIFLPLAGLAYGASYIFRGFAKAWRIMGYLLMVVALIFIALGLLGR